MKRRNILILIGLTSLVAGCSQRQQDDGPKIPRTYESTISNQPQTLRGRQCIVHLRRDALGIAGQGAIGPTSDRYGSTQNIAVRGTILHLDEQWLVLVENNREYRIPAAMILVLELPPSESQQGMQWK